MSTSKKWFSPKKPRNKKAKPHDEYMLSTGKRSNLANWRKICVRMFGKDSVQTQYLDKKIAEANGDSSRLVKFPESEFLCTLLKMGKAEQNGKRLVYQA